MKKKVLEMNKMKSELFGMDKDIEFCLFSNNNQKYQKKDDFRYYSGI